MAQEELDISTAEASLPAPAPAPTPRAPRGGREPRQPRVNREPQDGDRESRGEMQIPRVEMREPRDREGGREPRDGGGREPREGGGREPREGGGREPRERDGNRNNDPQRGNGSNAESRGGGDQGTMQFASGVLEILSEGWGFLRHGNFDQNGQDIYVAQAQIKRFNLRTGDTVYGQVRPPKDSEKYFGLLRVDRVNGADPEVARHRANFDELVPIYPDERLMLEIDPTKVPVTISGPREHPDIAGLTARFIDLVAPIGKGQRAIIVAPPKAGKTTILKTISLSISVNYPDVHLIAVLIDERPEEVTDIRRFVEKAYAGRADEGKPVGEVVSSTFDEQPDNHMRVADMVLEKAKRLVETGKDVVILLDSLTRLSRASNLTVTPSGRTLQGGLDPAAIYRPKRFFGAARNIENGGSLTIVASALVETGSRMDDIIFEEFKGTGNMELKLDRSLAERRIYPAIDIKASGTRKDELLYDQDSLKAVFLLHRALAGLQSAEATDFLIERLSKTKTNKEFLQMAGKTG